MKGVNLRTDGSVCQGSFLYILKHKHSQQKHGECHEIVLKLMDIQLQVMSVLYFMTILKLIETKVGLNQAKVF